MAVNERFDFTGRSVLITGGGKGLGKVYAEEFAKAGAHVVAADIDVKAAEAVAASLCESGMSALGFGVDVANEDSTKAMAQAALDRFGMIDVLVNNASLMSVLPRRDAGAKARQDRQHFLVAGLGRCAEPAALHDVQGWGDRIDACPGARGWRIRHHRQRAHSRHDAERDAGSVIVGELSRYTSCGPRYRARPGAGRSGGRGDVFVVAGQRFHDRPDNQCRRRQVDALIGMPLRTSFDDYTQENRNRITGRLRYFY
jgi:short chain dehydrogenase